MSSKIIRLISIIIVIAVGSIYASERVNPPAEIEVQGSTVTTPEVLPPSSGQALENLEVKGRAPKTGYERALFGNGWQRTDGCDTRNRILARDLVEVVYTPTTDSIVCKVQSGTLADPYSGKIVPFIRGELTSDDIQIDHIVALSDAWQKGAQQLSPAERVLFANDPNNLLAVEGSLNQQKGDGDAATWLPPNTAYRCSYVTKQIEVKTKYKLWVTQPEHDAIEAVLSKCSL